MGGAEEEFDLKEVDFGKSGANPNPDAEAPPSDTLTPPSISSTANICKTTGPSVV